MIEHSSYYGSLFESFIVLEIKKLIEYQRLDWELSYLKTKDDAEIDLVLSRPKNTPILIEIKSSLQIDESDLKHLIQLGQDLDQFHKKTCPKILISKDPLSREIQNVHCWHYSELFKRLEQFWQS